jgi:hypothetical protein
MPSKPAPHFAQIAHNIKTDSVRSPSEKMSALAGALDDPHATKTLLDEPFKNLLSFFGIVHYISSQIARDRSVQRLRTP